MIHPGRLLRAALAVMAWLAPQAARPAEDTVVALPPFIVEEASKGPPWRYARVDNFEVLSRCSERETRHMVELHHRLHQLLAEMLPPSLQVRHTLPKTLIFHDEVKQSGPSQEVITKMLEKSAAPQRIDEIQLGLSRGGRGFATPQRYTFLPNLRLWDRDGMIVFTIVSEGDNLGGDRLSLTHDYASYLVRSRVPAVSPWFVSGFLALYENVRYDVDSLSLPALVWISAPATAALSKKPPVPVKLIPLADFFSGRLTPADPTATPSLDFWRAQAALFVRWGLDGKGAPRRAGLFKFAEYTALRPAREEVFVECFGFNYAAAEQQLAEYLRTAVRSSLELSPPRLEKLPEFKIRLATETEIARIKGDWERLEVGLVKKQFPAVTTKYLEQARRTLRHAYDHGDRDPHLLAVLGLCEVDAGNDDEARDYLEAAALRSQELRPRAWFELARLRLAERLAQPGAADGRLSAAQMAEILGPLFSARSLEPALPEVYELIAEVWERGASRPQPSHLAVLTEGIALFPRQMELIYRSAALQARHGPRESATALINLGLRVAPDEIERARFEKLQAELNATP